MKCLFCKKKCSSVNMSVCKWCVQEMCMICLPIEKHKCIGMQKCKDFEKNKLTCMLENSKTVSTSNYSKF